MSIKIPIAPSGIDLATSRLVVQFLNWLHHRLCLSVIFDSLFYVYRTIVLMIISQVATNKALLQSVLWPNQSEQQSLVSGCWSLLLLLQKIKEPLNLKLRVCSWREGRAPNVSDWDGHVAGLQSARICAMGCCRRLARVRTMPWTRLAFGRHCLGPSGCHGQIMHVAWRDVTWCQPGAWFESRQGRAVVSSAPHFCQHWEAFRLVANVNCG